MRAAARCASQSAAARSSSSWSKVRSASSTSVTLAPLAATALVHTVTTKTKIAAVAAALLLVTGAFLFWSDPVDPIPPTGNEPIAAQEPAKETEAELLGRCGLFREAMSGVEDWRHVLIVTHWGFIRGLTGQEVANAAVVTFDPTAGAG